MESPVDSAVTVEISELQRLNKLLLPKLQNFVTIKQTTEINPPLIKSEKVSRKGNVEIQVDLIRWEQLPIDQRNLLFWHEVARIQNNTVHQASWEIIVLSMGLSGALVESITQNILLVSLALTVSGLAGYQLYRRNRGERSLREATAADEEAIAIATRFGYSLPKAYKSLSMALKTLNAQTSQKWLQKKYKVRLQVLKVSAAKAKETDSKLP